MDFGMAQQYGGDCYLRFDDTNPEAEKKEFIEHIQDIVAWLGWRPAKVAACLIPCLPAARMRLARGGSACAGRAPRAPTPLGLASGVGYHRSQLWL